MRIVEIRMVMVGLVCAAQGAAQVCDPGAMTDVYAKELGLTWTPENPFGSTEYILTHANHGPNINSGAHPVTARLYELDSQLDRFRLVVSRTTNAPVQVGAPFEFGQGGYNSTIVQGLTYELEVDYPCDTDSSNNRLFRIAHTANPDYVVFRDGMEGAPQSADGHDHGR